jgi:hypothetical protein
VTLTCNVTFASDGTKHRAWNVGNGAREQWRVTWMPERLLTQGQAEAAMNIAELVGTGWASPNQGITDINDWADELGMSATVAVQLVADRRSWGCAVRYADLPWQHKTLLLLLGTYFDSAGRYHRPTVAELAKATGLAEQHIVDLAFDLERDGWFSWHPVTGAECNADQPSRLLQLDHIVTSPAD